MISLKMRSKLFHCQRATIVNARSPLDLNWECGMKSNDQSAHLCGLEVWVCEFEQCLAEQYLFGMKWGSRRTHFHRTRICFSVKNTLTPQIHISMCTFMGLSFIRQSGASLNLWFLGGNVFKKKKPPDSSEIRLWLKSEQRKTRQEEESYGVRQRAACLGDMCVFLWSLLHGGIISPCCNVPPNGRNQKNDLPPHPQLRSSIASFHLLRLTFLH